MPWNATMGYAIMGLLALAGCLGSLIALTRPDPDTSGRRRPQLPESNGQGPEAFRGYVTFFFVVNLLLLVLAILGLGAELENPWQAIMSLALVLCTRLLNGLMFAGFTIWSELLSWGLGLLAAALVLL